MLFEAFKRMREERPGDPAFLVSSGDRSLPINWRQFTDDIDIVVRLVGQYAPGERVMLLGENSYEWFVAHVSIVFAGATVIPTDVNMTAQEIADRIRFTGASVLVYSALYAEKAHEVRSLVPGLMTGGFGPLKTERFIDRVRGLFKPVDSIWSRDSIETGHISMIVFWSVSTMLWFCPMIPFPMDAGSATSRPECLPSASAFSVAALITFSAASGEYSAIEANPKVPRLFTRALIPDASLRAFCTRLPLRRTTRRVRPGRRDPDRRHRPARGTCAHPPARRRRALPAAAAAASPGPPMSEE